MKTAFWFVGLFALAVALALLMGQNSATVTLFWAPYRVDMSFNLVLALVLAAFLLGYFSLRSMAALQSLPRRAARWRESRRERAVHAAVFDALAHQVAGRFVRARSAAREAIDQLEATQVHAADRSPLHAQWQAMGHLLAAESAHHLRDQGLRNSQLGLALAAASRAGDGSVLREGALLRAVRWAVEDRDLAAASHWLAQLPQGAARRTLALRLKLRVAQLAQDHTTALDTARLLAKHGAFSALASRSLLRGLFMDGLRACHDADQVRALWRSTDARDRQDPDLALAAAQRLLTMADAHANGDAHAAGVLATCREWVVPLWDAYATLNPGQQQALVQLVRAVFDGADAQWLARVETLQRQRPADPLLQFLAADVFYRQALWGKAQALFTQAVRGVPQPLKAHAWVRLAELAEQRGDAEATLAAWRAAALSPLNADTGP